MPREIERKFLPKSDAWRALAQRKQRMSQGYLASGGRASVRVRIAGDEARLNIKVGRARRVAPGVRVSDSCSTRRASCLALADGPLIDKTRHFVMHGGFEWEVDEFHGDNAGLVVAELELDARGRSRFRIRRGSASR